MFYILGNFSAYRTFMVPLVFKPTSIGASEEQNKCEDDLHFTSVSLHEKDTNSQTKNNILFMLNIVATFTEISLV
jgi:hypothetical protein